jgi:hypothetical protein
VLPKRARLHPGGMPDAMVSLARTLLILARIRGNFRWASNESKTCVQVCRDATGGGEIPRPPPMQSWNWLLRHHHVSAAILLPALFGMLGAKGMLFAPAGGGHAVRADAERDQVVLGRLRAP